MRLNCLPVLLLLLLAGCGPRSSRVFVTSSPTKAKILVDGSPVGSTPQALQLDLSKETRLIRVELEGFEPQEATVTKASHTDVMSPKDAACIVCISPCCLGLPLIHLLQPVDVDVYFRPSQLDFSLKRLGEGVAINAYPTAILVVDGMVRGQVTAATTPLQYREYLDMVRAGLDDAGRKTVLITVPGTRTRYEAVLHQTSQAYTDCEKHFQAFGCLKKSELKALEAGLDDLRLIVYDFMRVLSDPAPIRPLNEALFKITGTRLTREISCHFFRLPAGSHLITLQAEGCQPWTNQVQISPGEYLNLDVQLYLETSRLSVPPAPGFGPETLIYDGEHLLGRLKDTPDATAFPLLPGRHTIRARQGRLELIEDLEIREGEEHALDLEALARDKGPWLGATLAVENGEVRVTRVTPGGPAQKAGLQVGDRLLSLDAESLRGASLEVLERLVLSRAVGDTLALEVGRGDPAAPSLRFSLTLDRRTP